MFTTVFRCHLLLGDAMYAACVIGRYQREHPQEKVVVECLDEYPKEIYTWLPGVELTFATDTPCERRYVIDPHAAMLHACNPDGRSKQPKIPIWKAMGEILNLPSDDIPQLTIPRHEVPQQWKGAFILSPFSRSCSSHQGQPANKVLPTETWMPLLRYLRRRGKVLIVGSKNERMPNFVLDESERIAGYPLAVVASAFREARCVISLDNGLARLATLVGANTITLMPDFLPLDVFAPCPWGMKSSRVAQIDVRMDPLSFSASMKHLLREYARVV